MERADVIIIGVGVSGLAAALTLQNAGISCILLEATNSVGGRIKTIIKDGFTLDVGFQVLLENYSELKRFGIWDSLNFRKFRSGAIVSREGNLNWYSNPILDPTGFIKSGLNFPFPLKETSAVLGLYMDALRTNDDFQELKSAFSTMEYLLAKGISQKTIDEFFVPFFGGVLLDTRLEAGNQYFLWLFRNFMTGRAGLPLGGMQTLPFGLASKLKNQDSIRLNYEVINISDSQVYCRNGKIFQSSFIIDSTGQSSKLNNKFRSTTTVYLKGPVNKEISSSLVLNGNQDGNILHFCFPSAVQPRYAPTDIALCSVTLRNASADPNIPAILKELKQLLPDIDWNQWSYLHHFFIPKAIPEHQSGPKAYFRQEGNTFFVGDIESYPSINGAMRSGREAAEKIIELQRKN
jgi:phytoene dehydrogenase-like protein